MSSAASAQVVIEMSSSVDGATNRIYAKNSMLRMDSEQGRDNTTVIFRGEDMLFLNHDERSYFLLDKEKLVELSDQMNSALKQMEEQMANVPPEQRAMVERMMKGRMPGFGEAPAPLRVEMGGNGQEGDYSCTEYTIYRGDDKRFEICAAATRELGPLAGEAMEAFEAMAEFSEQLTQAFSQGPLGGMVDNPYQIMYQIEGFPVRTRDFDNGQVTSETRLTSIVRQELDDNLFTPPDDYKQEDMPGM
jgi:hypothetical protein